MVNRVPDGIAAAFKLSIVARVMNLPERQLRSWVDSGDLRSVQLRPGATRYITTVDVLELCDRLRLEPQWQNAVE